MACDTGERVLALAKEAGFARAYLSTIRQDGHPDDGKPALLTVWPYLRKTRQGSARVASFYFASQRAYTALVALRRTLCENGLPAHRDDGIKLKPLACRAGAGILGHNSVVIHPEYGMQIALGALVLDFAVETPPPQEVRRCEDCGACVRACPTKALERFALIDRPLCLRDAMLSGKPYPPALREICGDRLLGCEECIAACPHDRDLIEEGSDPEPELTKLLTLDKAHLDGLKTILGVNYIRPTRILQQALLVAGNSGDPSLLPLLEPHLASENTVVREHALWAMQRLTGDPPKEERP